MNNQKVIYYLERGNTARFSVLSEDCARVLGKRNADRFGKISEEAHYFSLAVNYHAWRLNQSYQELIASDSALQSYAENMGLVIGQGWTNRQTDKTVPD